MKSKVDIIYICIYVYIQVLIFFLFLKLDWYVHQAAFVFQMIHMIHLRRNDLEIIFFQIMPVYGVQPQAPTAFIYQFNCLSIYF